MQAEICKSLTNPKRIEILCTLENGRRQSLSWCLRLQ